MTLSEAAAYLEIPKATLRRLARQGRVRCLRTDGRMGKRKRAGRTEAFRITGRLHFRKEDLDAWRIEHQNEPTERKRDRRIANAQHVTSAALAKVMPKARVFPT